MEERILTTEETQALLKEEIESINTEIDRWAQTVDSNNAILNAKEKKRVHFFAKMTCTVCGHEHFVNRMELTQFENCEMAISARYLNAVLGFDYDQKTANELKEKYKKAANEEEKLEIKQKIEGLNNFYRVQYLCGNCANYFEAEFKRIFESKVIKNLNKTFI